MQATQALLGELRREGRVLRNIKFLPNEVTSNTSPEELLEAARLMLSAEPVVMGAPGANLSKTQF